MGLGGGETCSRVLYLADLGRGEGGSGVFERLLHERKVKYYLQYWNNYSTCYCFYIFSRHKHYLVYIMYYYKETVFILDSSHLWYSLKTNIKNQLFDNWIMRVMTFVAQNYISCSQQVKIGMRQKHSILNTHVWLYCENYLRYPVWYKTIIIGLKWENET